MARNTLIVVIVLAILAALVAGVNLTRPKTSINNQATPTPKANLLKYKNAACGVALEYPDTLNVIEGLEGPVGSGSAIFASKLSSGNVIILTCQKNIPRPSLSPDKIEELTSGSVSATLYHDASAKDGTPIDKLIFTNPNNGLDIFLSGFGPDFQRMIGNINLLK